MEQMDVFMTMKTLAKAALLLADHKGCTPHQILREASAAIPWTEEEWNNTTHEERLADAKDKIMEFFSGVNLQ